LQTFPRTYEIRISSDGNQWENVKSGSCEQPEVLISMDGAVARFIRIVHMGNVKEEGEIPWTMRQLKIFGKQESSSNLK
jgi:hypothetical protein